jgi:DNA (cytosine-5)-methyltransferase 1
VKILNLYAGIGGNRKLWTPNGDDHEITAVEYDDEIAAVYQDLNKKDHVIVGDAHEYLLNNFEKFDFIWASPPCQSHSQIRFNIGYKADRIYDKVKPIYPKMELYQEIILLQTHFDGLWVVENTIPYYEPLIPCTTVAGHVWWSNFKIQNMEHGNRNHRDGTVETLQDRKMIDISHYKIANKRQILRNCVEPEVGLHILNCAIKIQQPVNYGLFEMEF